METVLQLKNVTYRVGSGRAVLQGAELSLARGERVGVSGDREGLRALAVLAGGVDRPDAGEALVLGRRIYEMEAWEAAAFRNGHVGYASAAPGFWGGLTVLENAAMPLTVRGMSRKGRESLAMEALDAIGMGYAAHVYPKSLTDCELRLAALARALAAGPELLVLEDVLAGLDRRETERIEDALRDRWEAERFALLLLDGSGTGHAVMDRTAVLTYGRLGGV